MPPTHEMSDHLILASLFPPPCLQTNMYHNVKYYQIEFSIFEFHKMESSGMYSLAFETFGLH